MMLSLPSNQSSPDPFFSLSALSVSVKHSSSRRDDNTVQFSSRAEMATALLLEQYVPDFSITPGVSFQVPIGANKVCDFKINDTFIEFHPLNLHYDFDDRKALRDFKAALREIDSSYVRTKLEEAVRAELSEKYYRRRKLLIKLCCDPSSELIVVQNGDELYSEVIKRFGKNYPAKQDFLREFKKLCSKK